MSGSDTDARVLYVGDESDGLERAAEAFVVDVVSTREEALDRLGDGAYDCVVCEYDLPESTGVDLVEGIRDDGRGLPVVMCPSEGSEAIASEAISAGVTDYVGDEAGQQVETVLAETVRTAVTESQVQDRHRLLAAVESAAEGIALLGDDGRYEYVNDAYAALYGYEPDDLIGEHKDIVYPDDESFEDVVQALGTSGKVQREGTGVRADGTTVSIRYTVSTTAAGGYVCTSRDVTDRQRRQAELERQSSLLDSLFDQIPAHLYIKDRDGRHQRVSRHLIDDAVVNESAMDIEAYRREHIVGKTDIEINDSEHGRRAYADDMQVIQTGEPILNKEEYIADDGVWNLTSKVPWRDDDGTIRGIIGISQRITEQKRVEAELEQKNERLAEFANLVSHDLRNPLQTALGRTAVLQQQYEDENLDVIQRANERMEALIDDILLLAREGAETTDTDPVDLRAVAQECWEHAETAGTELVVDTDAVIRADESRLKRLFENLFANAASHGGDTVTVGDLAGAGFFVEDNGTGIPEDRREDVFEPGHSGSESGTGFGLSIVEQIADSHGWTVTLTDGSDGGARFEVVDVTVVGD